MNIYRTIKVSSTVMEGGHISSSITVGEPIFAKNYSHALIALSHKGMGDFTVHFHKELSYTKKLPVEWDSLILPSELQIN